MGATQVVVNGDRDRDKEALDSGSPFAMYLNAAALDGAAPEPTPAHGARVLMLLALPRHFLPAPFLIAVPSDWLA